MSTDEYNGKKTKFVLEDVDGYKCETTYINFYNCITRKCQIERFSSRNIFTIDNIKRWLVLNGKNIELLSNDFRGARLSLNWKCLNKDCLGEFDMSWNVVSVKNRLHVCGCPYCAPYNKRVGEKNNFAILRQDIMMDWNFDKNSDIDAKNILPMSRIMAWWICSKCSHEWIASVYNRNRGFGCPVCNHTIVSHQYSLETEFPDISEEWDYIKNYPLIPRDVFPSTSKKYYWICPDCKKSYLSSPNKRTGIDHRGCPQCCESKLEKKIRKFLETNYIEFVPQKRFDDCRDKFSLPFDFYLLLDNICIEANGKQHYEPVSYFGGEDSFVGQKIRDKIKKDYCIDKNIRLLEIPYWDYENIESILTKELNLNFSEHEISAEGKEN
jgi:hypothetical protein